MVVIDDDDDHQRRVEIPKRNKTRTHINIPKPNLSTLAVRARRGATQAEGSRGAGQAKSVGNGAGRVAAGVAAGAGRGARGVVRSVSGFAFHAASRLGRGGKAAPLTLAALVVLERILPRAAVFAHASVWGGEFSPVALLARPLPLGRVVLPRLAINAGRGPRGAGRSVGVAPNPTHLARHRRLHVKLARGAVHRGDWARNGRWDSRGQ